MTAAHGDGPITTSGEPYRALLAVSEAIVWHRDLSALFHELVGRLQQVVRPTITSPWSCTRRRVTPCGCTSWRPTNPPPPRPLWVEFPVGELPAGLVWQTSNR